jgi:hypothetical protein
MTEADLRTLVARVAAEVLAVQRAKRVMVLWAGALLGFPEAVASLTRLTALGVTLDYAQTPTAQRLLDQGLLASIGMTPAAGHYVASHDILIVPTLTANLTAKVSHGIADCLGSNVMTDFIQSGKPVIASRTGVDPAGLPKQTIYPAMPAGFAAILADNLARLAGCGVRLADADHLDAAVLACPGPTSPTAPPLSPVTPNVAPPPPAGAVSATGARLISHATVAPLAPGSTLRIAPHAIVTAQARDFARALGIRIEKEA